LREGRGPCSRRKLLRRRPDRWFYIRDRSGAPGIRDKEGHERDKSLASSEKGGRGGA